MLTFSKMFRLSVVLVAILCGLCAPLAAGGSISGRIVGGSNAFNLTLPWIVSITSRGRHICGGSIINKRTIVTAAHCLRLVDVSLLKVRVGSKTKSSGGQLIPVAGLKYHQNFQTSTMDFDIGVIRLRRDLEFSNEVQPVELPGQGENVPEGTDAIVSGWGYYSPIGPTAEYLQYAVVPIINQATCNRLMKNGITDRMLCAGVLAGGVDACLMDSGGPLVVGTKLVGIVSWGISCALPNKPGVYTRISDLVPWVADYLKQFNETL